ncbi:DP96R [African swine fever virus]|uniref:DP96R n=1 Tax=African swine fever virus TaxID=10497 RepID=A0A6G6CW62_ASF|nr:DP96R [African swine fever virus]QIE07108.1 DP96R [African swine fever virus]UTS58503.1 DP96R [African swine fever virus]UTS58664.1 DP96R [African swine fever virus]UTS58823.1 DP96R [African swine fever virus]
MERIRDPLPNTENFLSALVIFLGQQHGTSFPRFIPFQYSAIHSDDVISRADFSGI